MKYSSIQAYLNAKRKDHAEKQKFEHRVTFEPQSWCIPDPILAWKQANIDIKPKGRPTTLVIIGDSRTGKTSYAESIGENPIVMTQS